MFNFSSSLDPKIFLDLMRYRSSFYAFLQWCSRVRLDHLWLLICGITLPPAWDLKLVPQKFSPHSLFFFFWPFKDYLPQKTYLHCSILSSPFQTLRTVIRLFSAPCFLRRCWMDQDHTVQSENVVSAPKGAKRWSGVSSLILSRLS